MKKCPAGPENRLKSYRTAFFSLLAMTCLLLLFSLSGCVRQTGPESPPADESGSASLSWSGQKSIESGGLERTYLVHLPPSYMKGTPTPLLIAFHGGGGDGEGMERLTHMDDVSDIAGFIAVYPDGVDRNWNDGRPEINPSVDDVGFVRDLLKQLESDYSIDAKRVYATGISNGGFMSYRLALDLDGTFAAVAPVGALMTEQLCRKPPPASPVSVLLIMGKDDPFVPWSGGDVTADLKKRGTVVCSTSASAPSGRPAATSMRARSSGISSSNILKCNPIHSMQHLAFVPDPFFAFLASVRIPPDGVGPGTPRVPVHGTLDHYLLSRGSTCDHDGGAAVYAGVLEHPEGPPGGSGDGLRLHHVSLPVGGHVGDLDRDLLCVGVLDERPGLPAL